jgi:hypothetical protein
LALQVLLEVQLALVPHETLSDLPLTWQPCLHSFLGADAHPVTNPAIAAAMMNPFALLFIRGN